MDASQNLASLPTASPSIGPDPSTECAALRDLSFPALNQALSSHFAEVEGPKAGPWERGAFYVAVAGAGMGMLLGSLLNGKAGLFAAIAGLAIEMGGLAVSLFLQVKREWRQFRHARAQHAEEIELGFNRYQQLVQQVRAFPLLDRRKRLRYIQDRRSTMYERLSLFTGGFEKLGFMPVLLALYLQFKDWRWGDWSALGDVTLIQAMLAFLLLFAYAMSWHLIALRMRVQAYEFLLLEANRQDET